MSIELQNVVDAAQIVAGFTAAAVAFFVYRQMKQTDRHLSMTQQQMDSSLRPWVAIDFKGITNHNGRLHIRLKNYGQLPALRVRLWGGVSLEQPSKEQVMEYEKEQAPGESAMLPNSQRDLWLTIPDYAKVINAKLPVYIGIIAEYEYAKNKTGRYMIVTFVNFAKAEEGVIFEVPE